MDCLRAQEILSAALDHEAAAEELEYAKRHAVDCPDCRAFAEAMARISTVSAPRAPHGLSERVMAAVAEEERLRDAADQQALEALEDAGDAAPRRSRLASLFTPRRVAFGFAAATFAAAAVIGFAVVVAPGPAGRPLSDTAAPAVAPSSPYLSAPQGSAQDGGEYRAGGSDEDASASEEAAAKSGEDAVAGAWGSRAPSYVSMDGRVYVLEDAQTGSPSNITTAGIVVTAHGGRDKPSSWYAYVAGGRPEALWVSRLDGTYDRYTLVVRKRGGERFALVNGANIERWGVWPKLPPGMGAPVRADGTPGFVPGGSDDASMPVFASAGHTADEGFALGPGTPPTDPAAGNPNWTWWEPIGR